MARSRASANYTITADDRTRAGLDSAGSSFARLSATAARAGLAVAAVGAVAGAAGLSIVGANAQSIDSLGKLSEKTGIGVASLQAFSDASERAGIAQTTLAKSLQKGLDGISEAATGVGEAKNALDALGLSSEQLQRIAPEERILAVLDALKQVDDEGDKIRIASDIFGARGADLVRLYGDEVRGAADRMRDLNLALTESDVSGVETMNDTLQLVQSNARAAGLVFTAEMAPAITGVVRQIFGMGESLDGVRSVSEDFGNFFVDVIGFIGNGVEGLDNAFDSLKIGLQEVNVLASRAGAFFGDDEAEAQLQGQLTILQQLKDELAGQVGDQTFWSSLEDQVASARAESVEAARDLEALRQRFETGVDLGITVAAPTPPAAPTRDTGVITAPAANDSQFEAIVSSLATETESIQIEYQRRIDIIDQFKRDYPARIQEATDAELRAIEARVDALAELDKRQEDDAATERQATLQPLVANLDDTRSLLQDETDTIIDEITRRQGLLQELGELDVARREETSELIIRLEEEKQARIAGIEARSASARKQQQANFAASALGIAASLVDSIAGESNRGAKIAARIAQTEALVAGISAAERARNQASLYGGVVGGGIAAALSWAGTIANVAGIEAALQGGTPSGASSTGGSVSTTAATRQALESGGTEAAPVQVTFVLDDQIINREAIKELGVDGIVEGSSSTNVIVNSSGKIVRNTERAA